MRSTDGVTWEQFTTNVTETGFETVIHDGTKFCAVGNNNYVYTSTDGQSWAHVGTISAENCLCVRMIFANGTYVVLLDDTTGYESRIAHSKDLINWTFKRASDFSWENPQMQNWGLRIHDGTYGNGRFVVSGGSLERDVYYQAVTIQSEDGESWTAERVAFGGDAHVVFYRKKFLMYSSDAHNEAIISNDGVNWKYVYFPYRGTFAVCAGDKLIAFDGDSSAAAYSDGTVDVKSASIGVNFDKITSIVLNGFQECDYVLVSDGNLSAAQKETILYNYSYHPKDIKALFYADFDSGTNAGGFGNTGVTDFAIYRTSPGNDDRLMHIYDISVGEGDVVIDASAATGIQYVYYAYEIGSGATGVLESNQIATCIWDWSILSCTQDTDGAYHTQQIFMFGKNLTTGDISNNNTPQILQNFTQYPTIQMAPFNYKSGTLTSLIGTISDGRYSDTAKLRNDILALSTTSNTLFLKSRKGDIVKIRISGAIEYSVLDNSPTQAQTVKIPWVEVGDADDSRIIITKYDATWPY